MAKQLNLVPLAQVPTQVEVEDAVRQLQQVATDTNKDVEWVSNTLGSTINTVESLLTIAQSQQTALTALAARVVALEEAANP